MKCGTSRHEWTGSIDASRCCSRLWTRELRARGDEHDLDPEGRIYDDTGMVHGWVFQDPEQAMARGKITQDDVHNLHVTKVHDRLNATYSPSIMQALAAAHHRHHDQGTSAKVEADAINAEFGLTS